MGSGYRGWTLWRVERDRDGNEVARERASEVVLLTRGSARLYFADDVAEGERELVVDAVAPRRERR